MNQLPRIPIEQRDPCTVSIAHSLLNHESDKPHRQEKYRKEYESILRTESLNSFFINGKKDERLQRIKEKINTSRKVSKNQAPLMNFQLDPKKTRIQKSFMDLFYVRHMKDDIKIEIKITMAYEAYYGDTFFEIKYNVYQDQKNVKNLLLLSIQFYIRIMNSRYNLSEEDKKNISKINGDITLNGCFIYPNACMMLPNDQVQKSPRMKSRMKQLKQIKQINDIFPYLIHFMQLLTSFGKDKRLNRDIISVFKQRNKIDKEVEAEKEDVISFFFGDQKLHRFLFQDYKFNYILEWYIYIKKNNVLRDIFHYRMLLMIIDSFHIKKETQSQPDPKKIKVCPVCGIKTHSGETTYGTDEGTFHRCCSYYRENLSVRHKNALNSLNSSLLQPPLLPHSNSYLKHLNPIQNRNNVQENAQLAARLARARNNSQANVIIAQFNQEKSNAKSSMRTQNNSQVNAQLAARLANTQSNNQEKSIKSKKSSNNNSQANAELANRLASAHSNSQANAIIKQFHQEKSNAKLAARLGRARNSQWKSIINSFET